MSTAILAFFWFPFAWNNFFHSLIFILYVSLVLTWISYRQYLYWSCFCIHSTVCLLSLWCGAFNLFTFEVIINMYVLVALLLIALDLFIYRLFYKNLMVMVKKISTVDTQKRKRNPNTTLELVIK